MFYAEPTRGDSGQAGRLRGHSTLLGTSISLWVPRSEVSTRLNEVNKKWKVAERTRLCGAYLMNIAALKAGSVLIRATFAARQGSCQLASGKWS